MKDVWVKRIGLALGMLVLGWVLSYVYYSNKNESNFSVIRENSPEYQFINPFLLIENSGAEFDEYDALQLKIEESIDKMKEDELAFEVSVYFRDLNTAKWTGVNEKVLYSPSSMLKIITLLAYLNVAQNDPEILREKIDFTYTPDPGQYYVPAEILPSGQYTVRELLVRMIVDSDNSAMSALNGRRIDKIYEVYKELDLPDPRVPTNDFMSAEVFSRVLRTLYSSTYLSRTYSEEALKLLANTKFDKGLVAGVGSVQVSHKFGEHTLKNVSGEIIERQLHDCGIIYKLGSPYLLCVMTRGKDFQDLEKVISNISSLVFNELN